MNIILMANGFPPELTSTRLNFEMAKELSQRGHRVQVVTVLPRKRYSGVSEAYTGKIIHREALTKTLRVLRVGFPLSLGEGLAGRAVQYILMPLYQTVGVLISPSPDIILCESPPLLAGISAWFACKVKRTKFAIRIQDIHPDVLEETGLIKSGLLISVMRMIERFVYQKATLVTTISPAYEERIRSKGVSRDKVKYIPNWADDHRIPPDKPGELRRKLNLLDAFVITYAGTMSWFQDLETVLEAAKIVGNHARIQFLLIGDGALKDSLTRKAEQLDTKNVTFLPFQSRELYYDTIASSDVCLVSLKKAVTTPEMPSKVLEIMMAGTPILANVPRRSEISLVVKEADCGLVIEPENPRGFAEAVTWLYDNRIGIREAGLRGKRYASERFSLNSSISNLEKELTNLNL
jgi:colanic acid biosynthesis glycosyl transferase WcaI